MKNKEPLFHIVKRDSMPWYYGWLVRLSAIVLALFVCAGITMLVTKLNPLDVAASLCKGAFGGNLSDVISSIQSKGTLPRKLWVTIQNTSILLLVAIAVTPAFKMRFWNIGAEGQVLMGCFGAASCMILLTDKVPNWLLVVIMFAASVAAGAVWAGIPAFFKAKWGTNETLFTLMMNYIATQIVACYCIVWENPKGSGTIGLINSKLNQGWVQIGNKYLFAIIAAAVVTLIIYIYLNYTKNGYEISVVGESERTARYVGIKVERVIIRTLLISGAICGLVGFILVCGVNHTLTTTLAGGRGFTAVMVSWMAQFNPFTMILTSGLIVVLEQGASEIATNFGLNSSFSAILTGIIIFFLIGCEFFINYKINFRSNNVKEEKKNA